MAGVLGFTCVTCKAMKEIGSFLQKKDSEEYYQTCTPCWQKQSAKFWKGKRFKVCKGCDIKRAIRLFDKDDNGIPYSKCMECYEETVANAHRAKRVAEDAETARKN